MKHAFNEVAPAAPRSDLDALIAAAENLAVTGRFDQLVIRNPELHEFLGKLRAYMRRGAAPQSDQPVAAAQPDDLLEDEDGAPYPSHVQEHLAMREQDIRTEICDAVWEAVGAGGYPSTKQKTEEFAESIKSHVAELLAATPSSQPVAPEAIRPDGISSAVSDDDVDHAGPWVGLNRRSSGADARELDWAEKIGLPQQKCLKLADAIVTEYGRAPYSDGTLFNQHVLKIATLLESFRAETLARAAQLAYVYVGTRKEKRYIVTQDELDEYASLWDGQTAYSVQKIDGVRTWVPDQELTKKHIELNYDFRSS